jgi:hypothetical protein
MHMLSGHGWRPLRISSAVGVAFCFALHSVHMHMLSGHRNVSVPQLTVLRHARSNHVCLALSREARAPAKHVGVAALEPHHCRTSLSKLQEQLVNLTLQTAGQHVRRQSGPFITSTQESLNMHPQHVMMSQLLGRCYRDSAYCL